ncbi:hypothetical protein [Cryobacterium sp. Y50]|uniref:hypothetical protein n=1 Tax=Cryobacterium sp. Y50 TaxID=2048286 RepID=UPI0018EC5638|nr:hypothetical protein [Cryobacterium sp. Y50]
MGRRVLRIEYGLLIDRTGRPIAIRVVLGKSADPTAFEQIAIEMKRTFGVTDMVGDRGVITSARILARVERDFCSRKSIDLDLRPIHHWTENRVRVHVLLYMLAAHLVWHLRRAWESLTFTGENWSTPTDPVAPALCSTTVHAKASTRTTGSGEPAQRFTSLLRHLATSPATACTSAATTPTSALSWSPHRPRSGAALSTSSANPSPPR